MSKPLKSFVSILQFTHTNLSEDRNTTNQRLLSLCWPALTLSHREKESEWEVDIEIERERERKHCCVAIAGHPPAGAGVEACKECAQGYLMEGWRCVSACSAGFYTAEPGPEIADGHRICRRWALWCVFRCGRCVFICWRQAPLWWLSLFLCVWYLAVCLLLGRPFFPLYTCVCARVNVVSASRGLSFSLRSIVRGLLLRCDARCRTCTGPSGGNCSSCSSGHSLQEGACVVNSQCTDGQSAIRRH